MRTITYISLKSNVFYSNLGPTLFLDTQFHQRATEIRNNWYLEIDVFTLVIEHDIVYDILFY